MKVAIVTHFPQDPSAPAGGVEAVSVALVRSLAAYDDLEIHVVTANSSGREQTTSWQGAIVHQLPAPTGSMLGFAVGAGRRQVSRYLMDLQPDIVHAHDTYGIMVKGLPLPRVFTVHGFIYGDTLISGRRCARLWSLVWKKVETAAWADQANIISISPYVRERVAQYSRARIFDIDNPIDPSFFDIGKSSTRNIVFSAAVISPRKNTLTLVRSFAKVLSLGCDARLHLAGTVTEPAYGEAVREYIHKKGLEKKVLLLGRLDSAQVKKELAQASVFALVSLEENSPMGIEEAMAASLPVVTSNRCGMPYMVRDSESGYLVDPFDVGQIADRLHRLLGDPDLVGKMGRKGRKIALDRFHPDVVARRTRAVYYDIVQSAADKRDS